MDVSTPVVVLGSARYGGLAVARSLGRLGIPVYGLNDDRRILLFSSRYCKGGFLYDFAAADRERPMAKLLDFGRELGRPILICTSDAAALFVARHSNQLRDAFRFPFMAEELVQSLSNKRQMFLLARRLGVPTPNSFFPESRAEALDYAKTARFPVIMKPLEVEKAKLQSRKAIVATPEDLIAKYDLMSNPEFPNLMLQEYIPGGEEASWMFNGYFDENSICRFGATGYKIRQYPPYAGVTSLGACAANQTVFEITARFMAGVGYRGILDIGYRYDARDGQYKVFDVNPRLGCTFRLFVSDRGMDVVRALYFDLTRQSFTSGVVRNGRRWMVEDLDTVSSFHYWRKGALGVKNWLASFRGLEECALFAWDDLKPIAQVAIDDFRCGGRKPPSARSPTPQFPPASEAAARR